MNIQATPSTQAKIARKACAHCGIPTDVTNSSDRAFCCSGCMGAYALIHEMGLDDYYELRKQSGVQVDSNTSSLAKLLEDPAAAGIEIKSLDGGYECARLSVEGIHCAACSWLIERMQPNIQGLYSARVRMSDNTVELVYKPTETNLHRIANRLAPLGYNLVPWSLDTDFEHEVTRGQRQHWSRIALAAFFAANSMWIGISLYAGESTGISKENEAFLRWMGALLGLLAAVLPGRIFFQTAWQSIRQRSPHVDIPVAISLTIGTIGSIYGAATAQGHIYFDSLASLILLLLIGRYIQFRAQIQARKSIGKLLRWNTPVAKVLEPDGRRTTVKSDRLKPGQIVVVAPGETFPADGILTTECTEVETSLLTGESVPTSLQRGDIVIGGTTNLTENALVQVTASGEESRVGKLLKMVKEATTYKTPWIQAADWVGKWFVIIVLMIASITWISWSMLVNMSLATQHTMALLTIACPCALALAAPLVITIALGRAAKKRIWIRDGVALERLATPGFIWFDKTGTLTTGQMTVHFWKGDDDALAMAAACESKIQHPIAQAITRFTQSRVGMNASDHECSNRFPKAESIKQIAGKGTVGLCDSKVVRVGNRRWMEESGVLITDVWEREAIVVTEQGFSVIFLSIDEEIVGLFGVGDQIKPDTIRTLRQLQSLGWQFGILSGDSQSVVDKLAKNSSDLGIHWSQTLGDQSPEEKREVVRSFKTSNKFGSTNTSAQKIDASVTPLRSPTQNSPQAIGPVVMVGDGVNDAAALAEADVGISVRGNSEQCLAIAPIYLAHTPLSSLVELMTSSREVVRGIRRCFAISLVYNCITISLAALGLIHPLIAAIFMPLSGVSVLIMAFQSRAFLSNRPYPNSNAIDFESAPQVAEVS